jgi:hypothetical protein
MSTFQAPDSAGSRLRATVAAIDREIDRLRRSQEGAGPNPLNALVASWADLVHQLALGPEPAMRICPYCKRYCMSDATRCGYCWTTLSNST